MYDDLVKRLRYCADSDNLCSECKYRFGSPDGSKMCLDLLMVDAADAIEELSMKLHGDEAAIAGMKREIERMVIAGKPRWIPVTERLPEEPAEEKGENFCADCHWYEAEEQYCFRNGCHAYNESTCEHWEPMPADEPIPAPGGKTDPTTYDLLYEEGGYNSNGV